MTREALADRIITYCDALAAFSLVNALAFVITLADPDIRCSIAGIASVVIASNLVFVALITVGLVSLRRFECSLRSDGARDARVERFWVWMHGARIVLVWVVAVFVSVGTFAATVDPSCASGS